MLGFLEKKEMVFMWKNGLWYEVLDNYVSRWWRKLFGLEMNWLKNLGDDEIKKSFNVLIWLFWVLVDLEGNSWVYMRSCMYSLYYCLY